MTQSTVEVEPGGDRMPRLKLVVTEEISDEVLARFRPYAHVQRSDYRPEALHAAARDADALLVRTYSQIDRALLDNCPRVRVIARMGVGLDNFDLDACAERGIEVINAPGQNAIAVAEMAMLMMLTLARRTAFDRTALRAWDKVTATGAELHGRVLGIVGFGAVGRQVAARAQAFGMRVIANDPYIPDHAWGSVTPVSKAELRARADIVTLHVPATPETVDMVDERFLAAMRPGAWLINTARGTLVDEDALLAALDSGHIGGAALDVRRVEPGVEPNLFLDRPNVLLSPHVAGFTTTSLGRVADYVSERLEAGLRALVAQRVPAVT